MLPGHAFPGLLKYQDPLCSTLGPLPYSYWPSDPQSLPSSSLPLLALPVVTMESPPPSEAEAMEDLLSRSVLGRLPVVSFLVLRNDPRVTVHSLLTEAQTGAVTG